MKTKTAALATVGGFAIACLIWRSRQGCERACEMANEQAVLMYQKGDFVAALNLIDQVDARCRCGRFTSGDAPPHYSLALACLRELSKGGRSAEIEFILSQSRGPILAELANNRGFIEVDADERTTLRNTL